MEQLVFSLIRRWAWLIGLATLIAAATTYWVSGQQPPSYEARARLIIGPGVASSNPNLDALRAGSQLLQTYTELATTRPVLQGVIDDLKLDLSLDDLDKQIEVTSNNETQILSIRVQGGDPAQVATVANAVADMLVLMSPFGTDGPEVQLKNQMRNQAAMIEENIREIQAIIEQLENELGAVTDVAEQRAIMEQVAAERNRLTDSQRTLALLYNSLGEAPTNQVKIIEPAISGERVPTQLRLKVLIGAMAGLALSLSIALSFEYFDDTIRGVGALARVTDLPTLGAIARHKPLSGDGRQRLVVWALPDSRAAEDYRTLLAKLVFSDTGPQSRSMLILSPDIDHDTGEIAANLAITMAQTGSRVVLVDASLRRPKVGELFGIADRDGLAQVLSDPSREPDLISVGQTGLSVLPSGPVTTHPFEQLASPRMADVISGLTGQADMVIIVGSPPLLFGESMLLASRVDGVVLAVRNGAVGREVVRDVARSLRLVGARIIGTVLDNNPRRRLRLISRRKMTPHLAADGDRGARKGRLGSPRVPKIRKVQ